MGRQVISSNRTCKRLLVAEHASNRRRWDMQAIPAAEHASDRRWQDIQAIAVVGNAIANFGECKQSPAVEHGTSKRLAAGHASDR